MKARYWLICLVALTACGEELDPAPVMERLYRQRVELLSGTTLRRCEEAIQAEALLRADSLLADRRRRLRFVEGRPPRPARPREPPVRELSAPLPLRPLFPFEIRFDSLLRDSLLQDSIRQDSILRVDSLLMG